MFKKLCFIVPEYQPQTATHFNYIYGLIENLRKEMDIFLIIEKGSPPDFLPRNKFYVQKFSFLPLRVLENILIIKYARLRGYKDFYIHYSFLSAFNASLIVKFLGGRTFYWNCGLPWKYKRSLIRETFELLTYKLITYLVTGTEGLKKEYADHYKLPLSKIKVLPNWIDLKKEERGKRKEESEELKKELNIRPDQEVLLFAHRLSKRKGVHYLPEIAKRLNFMIPDSSFVILVAGDGPEREDIELRIKNYELWNKVRFLGWVPQNEIMNYFAIADIFLLPSEEEGFPHVLLEAMAGGVPFVAFDVGGVREVIPPTFYSFIVSGGKVDDFSEKVREIISFPSEKVLALKAVEKSWTARFDLPLILEKFRNILE